MSKTCIVVDARPRGAPPLRWAGDLIRSGIFYREFPDEPDVRYRVTDEPASERSDADLYETIFNSQEYAEVSMQTKNMGSDRYLDENGYLTGAGARWASVQTSFSQDNTAAAAAQLSTKAKMEAERQLLFEGKDPTPRDVTERAFVNKWTGGLFSLSRRDNALARGQIFEEMDRDRIMLENMRSKAAYAESTASTGANLVPTVIAGDILRVVQDSAVVFPRCRHIPMTSNDLRIPNEAGGVTIYWSSEAATLTQGEGTFGQNTLTAKKLIGRAKFSREVADDAVPSLVPYLQNVFGEAFARELDQEILEGTGSNFTGVNAATGVNSIATTTTDGDFLTYGDLVSLIYQSTHQSTREGAAFFMNPQIFATVVNLTDSNGQPIFQYSNVAGAAPMRVLGYPCYLTSAASVAITRGSTGSTGNVYFGDPRNLIVGDRMDMRFEVTDQASWSSDQFDVRMIGRWGFTVGNPSAWSKLVGCKKIGS